MAEREETGRRQLMRKDPFQQLQDLQEEIGRWWDRDWWPWPVARMGRRWGGAPWAPRVDMYEDGGEVVIKAELPGVKREDVTVTVEDNDLVLCGERKFEKEIKEEHFFRLERGYGSFYRRLPLPVSIDPDKIKAKFQEGVLEVRMPKPTEEAPKGKRIDVT